MEQAANLYSPLSLAYLGDAVYSLLVRERLMREHLAPAGVLHRYAARYVSAAAQSRACETLLPLLEEDEMRVYNRGATPTGEHTETRAAQRLPQGDGV